MLRRAVDHSAAFSALFRFCHVAREVRGAALQAVNERLGAGGLADAEVFGMPMQMAGWRRRFEYQVDVNLWTGAPVERLLVGYVFAKVVMQARLTAEQAWKRFESLRSSVSGRRGEPCPEVMSTLERLLASVGDSEEQAAAALHAMSARLSLPGARRQDALRLFSTAAALEAFLCDEELGSAWADEEARIGKAVPRTAVPVLRWALCWRLTPIDYREGYRNPRTGEVDPVRVARLPLDAQMLSAVTRAPPGARGAFRGLVQRVKLLNAALFRWQLREKERLAGVPMGEGRGVILRRTSGDTSRWLHINETLVLLKNDEKEPTPMGGDTGGNGSAPSGGGDGTRDGAAPDAGGRGCWPTKDIAEQAQLLPWEPLDPAFAEHLESCEGDCYRRYAQLRERWYEERGAAEDLEPVDDLAADRWEGDGDALAGDLDEPVRTLPAEPAARALVLRQARPLAPARAWWFSSGFLSGALAGGLAVALWLAWSGGMPPSAERPNLQPSGTTVPAVGTTSVPPKSAACDALTARILKPQDGDVVPNAVLLDGVYAATQASVDLWAVVEPDGMRRLHPQRGPLQKGEGCHWSGTAYIGSSAPGADTGSGFVVHLVAANADASEAMRAYLRTAGDRGFPGLASLPAGAIELSSIRVARDDGATK